MLLLLLSIMVHAREVSPQTPFIEVPFVQGQFQSRGAYQVLSHQRSEEVEVQTAEGQRRLDELLTEGYKCSPKNNETMMCLKALQVAGGVHPGLKEAAEELWSGRSFSFEQVIGEPELGTNTEFYKQWTVPQKAVLWKVPLEMEELVWNPLTYAWMQDEWYVYLGSSLGSPYFAIKIEKQILKVSEKIEIQKGPVVDRYFVHILFEKVK